VNPLRLQTQTVVVAAAFLLAGCEARDEALQKELSDLREAARAAKEEAEAAKARLAKVQLVDAETLRAGLSSSLESFKRDLPSLFPGYRVGSIEPGEIYYVFSDSSQPYRSRMKVAMQGTESAARTPELPSLLIEVKADPSGAWSLPDQAKLREIQAAAMAKASERAQATRAAQQGQRQAAAPQAPAQPPPQRPQTPVPSDPNARVISWGDEPAAPPPAANPPPAQPGTGGQRRPNPNLPKADQSYEIRFD